MTCNMLLIYFVTRHSYNSDNLYPDWQKPRRALLLAAVWRDTALNKKKSILVTASSRSATLTEFYRRAVSKNAGHPLNWPRTVS
jgi:hypothetical protein